MEKNKRWQIALIAVVLLLTLYNILPTLFFYSRPLNQPIQKQQALAIANESAQRVNQLEVDAKNWVQSFAKLLKVKVKSIDTPSDAPQEMKVAFHTSNDAAIFKKYLPNAGQAIPFFPARLTLSQQDTDTDPKIVTLHRKIPIHFSSSPEGFQFAAMDTSADSIDSLYKKVTSDRLLQIADVVGGMSDNAQLLSLILQENQLARSDEFLMILSGNVLNYVKTLGENSPITKRFFASFTQGNFVDKSQAVQSLIGRLDALKEKMKLEKVALLDEEKNLQKTGEFLDGSKKQQLEILEEKEADLLKTTAVIRKHARIFASGITPLHPAEVEHMIDEAASQATMASETPLSVGKYNPLIEAIAIDWPHSKFNISFHPDVLALKESLSENPSKAKEKELVDQLIFNEIARISRETNEKLIPNKNQFQVSINSLTDAKSMLVLDLKEIAQKETGSIRDFLKKNWSPASSELSSSAFPIVSEKEYQQLSAIDKKFCLLVTSPLMQNKTSTFGFRNSSIYVIAKGLGQMLEKYNKEPSSDASQAFFASLNQLQASLNQLGFTGYPGTTYPLPAEYAHDYIFEAENYYLPILMATREEFNVYGTKRYATLEFTNLKQRILRTNTIETEEQEELLKWRDEYQASQVDPAKLARFEIPAPTKNPLFSNLALSARKYFRGDDRKILNWGLDLSGGKTVQVELRDHKGQQVTNEADINQGINELYNRVNKMGVSEVSIRREGSNITLDFPGSQGLSAKDLIKASSMSFHVINEKFSIRNPLLRDATNRFLLEVWNEAIVTNKKDVQSINEIAWNHLYGDPSDAEVANPRSESAKILYKNGLRLANPNRANRSSSFDDSTSMVACYRGDSILDWNQQNNPLLIVFNNYALEGADLDHIHAGFDPAEGNFLSFEVNSSRNSTGNEHINPRNELYNWTSIFSKEKVIGTSYEKFSSGEGWRMAVILNGQVISSPQLAQPLKTNGRITGSFTQREIAKLEADLKAGSLTFTPYILSEKNVSPELGIKERRSGIIATVIALSLVIAVMVVYYRFAGVIASVAVLLNLLIMWATLQNLQATITLATIAGIILTMGMAVDANVLIFERIREEFTQSGRIALAIQTGYKKAFSAILDSNITTIIAALILLNFDSGPIKGFALSLIIGIVSSMFTALFFTRCFFRIWVQKPEHKTLNMLNWIRGSHFNFLKFGKPAFVVVALIALIGAFSLTKEKSTILGMDFTGGYALTLEVKPSEQTNYRQIVEKAFEKHGLTSHDFSVRELTPSNQLRIFLAKNLERQGQPFAGLSYDIDPSQTEFAYQTNPKIVWIVNALQESGIALTEASIDQLDTNWTSISGQMSDSMRNNAIIGLGIALICILLYITFRFEFKFAMSATIALAIDVVVTLALIAILHLIGVPVQIDLNTIAALMTIIGYSLNDTIIVFDRIREDMKTKRKESLFEIINHSLNVTLSRTIMTSLTTFVVLIALIVFGGQTIFGFSLVMAIGVVVGTLSTLFIASLLLHSFQKKESSNSSRAILSMQ